MPFTNLVLKYRECKCHGMFLHECRHCTANAKANGPSGCEWEIDGHKCKEEEEELGGVTLHHKFERRPMNTMFKLLKLLDCRLPLASAKGKLLLHQLLLICNF